MCWRLGNVMQLVALPTDVFAVGLSRVGLFQF